MHTPDSGEQQRPATPSSVLPPAFGRPPSSPIRFAATTGAFGLTGAPSTAAIAPSPIVHSPSSTTSPPSNGTVPASRRVRRPSLLSLIPVEGLKQENISPTALLAVNERSFQPSPRWGASPFASMTTPERVSSAPPIEGLRTSASPAPGSGRSDHGGASPMTMDEDRRWPTHPQRRKSSTTQDDVPLHPKLQGRPLPGALLATLISESAPLEHEMRSEARLQRLLSSHPSALPLTPRQRRNLRMSRGRFPEMVDDDDDYDDAGRRLSMGARWRAGSSDTDSDDMMEDDFTTPAPGAGAVNTAFASIMDLDRPPSSGSSWHRSDSGKSTPGGPRKPRNGVAPSPGTGLQLPTAFGALGMSGTALSGAATPIGSPTAEKADLVGSPSTMAAASPSMMQYRDAPVRTGKRKAAAEERFDPYKRPRGSSPSPFQNGALSPSKPTAIPIPSSPSHVPLLSSALALNSPGYLSLAARPVKPAHPYTRPMSSRSRAASPALSIGSTSGVLSGSLGSGGLTKEGKPLAGPFIPTGQGVSAVVNAALESGQAPASLGSLGLLSLTAQRAREQEQQGKMEID